MYSRKQLLLCCAGTFLVTLATLAVFRQTMWPSVRKALGWDVVAPSASSLPAMRKDSTSFITLRELRDPLAVQVVEQRFKDMVDRRNLAVGFEKQREFMQVVWDLDVYKNMFWLGIPVIKTPADMWMMQQLIVEVRPDFIIEAGTHFGGSALYFAHVLDGLELADAKVLTIDIVDMTQQVSQIATWRNRVEFIQGSSTDPSVVSQVRDRVQGKKVIVVLDSLHTKEHVLAELKAYSSLVSLGSYLIVEDTALDGIPLLPEGGPGAAAATDEFLASPDGMGFEVDSSREAYLVTLHPGGWLRRVR